MVSAAKFYSRKTEPVGRTGQRIKLSIYAVTSLASSLKSQKMRI